MTAFGFAEDAMRKAFEHYVEREASEVQRYSPPQKYGDEGKHSQHGNERSDDHGE
jgi:hypothetical protein